LSVQREIDGMSPEEFAKLATLAIDARQAADKILFPIVEAIRGVESPVEVRGQRYVTGGDSDRLQSLLY
jgi:hypothetical protein